MISKEEFQYLKRAVDIAVMKGTSIGGPPPLRIVSREDILKALDEAYEALVPPAYRGMKGGGGDAR